MSELIDKRVAISITCVRPDGTELDSFETSGRIEVVDERWIGVRREGFTELFGLPPAPELLEPALGDSDEGPDYTASLTIQCNDPESLLVIRGIGFAPQS